MSRELYPSGRVVCQHSECSRDDPEIGHEETAFAGFDRSGKFVEPCVVCRDCYNLRGPREVKKKYGDKVSGQLKEVTVRYEVSPEHMEYSMPQSLVNDLQDHIAALKEMLEDKSGGFAAYDERLKEASRELKERHDVHVAPQMINNQVVSRMKRLGKGMMVGEIVSDATSDEFVFESFYEVKKLDFVAVCPNYEEADVLLCQVHEVTKTEEGQTRAKTRIIGYRDEDGLLKKPRSAVAPGSNVYIADQDLVSETLGLDSDGLDIGVMENEEDITVYMDPDDFFQHTAIIAKTGYGKSYLAGIMVEEAVDQRIPVVVIDPHGEYWTMRQENNGVEDRHEELYGVEPDSYNVEEWAAAPEYNEDRPDQLRFGVGEAGWTTFQRYIMQDLSTAQRRELKKVIDELQTEARQGGGVYGVEDILRRVEEADMPKKTKQILLEYIGKMQDSGLYGRWDSAPPEQLVTPGRVSVLNLRGVDDYVKQHVTKNVVKELFEARKRGDVPPFILVVEETQKFAPSSKKKSAPSLDAISQVASEGRKFGMGLAVISQRPSKINNEVLSQCKQQCILKVNNDADVKTIRQSFENVTSEVSSIIRSLPQGVAMVLGKEYPLITDVRVRKSKHGGEGATFKLNDDDKEVSRE